MRVNNKKNKKIMSLFATEDGPTFSREYDSDSSCESEYEKECQEYQIILDKAIPNKNNKMPEKTYDTNETYNFTYK